MKTGIRNESIDTLKFLLIFAIFIGHYGETAGKLYLFVFSYHVPLFFVVSGFWLLERERKPILTHITQGVKRYLFPWMIWVLIYSITLGIEWVSEPSEIRWRFLDYFKAVKGTGIGGMWFVPCFFLVSISYQVVDAFTAWIRGSKVLRSGILFLCFFFLRVITDQLIPKGAAWMFTLHRVPEYLVFYSMGSFLWQIYIWFQEKNRNFPRLRKGVILSALCVSLLYMAFVYFEKHARLWTWIPQDATVIAKYLPEIILLISALIMNVFLAKNVSSKLTVALGKETLYLCLSESWVKNMMVAVAGTAGITLAPNSPTQSVIFSLAALVTAHYTAIPLTKYLMRTIEKNIRCLWQ